MSDDAVRRQERARNVLVAPTPDIVAPTGLRAETTEALREELARALTVTAENLTKMAAIWAELERRGEDLSALRSGIAVYLPLIARGTLDARLVVRYAGQTMLLRHIAELTKEEQAQLVEDDTVTLVVYEREAFVETRRPISELGSKLISQVISGGRIVSAEDQKPTAQGRANRAGPSAKATRVERIARDRESDPGGGRTQMVVEMSPEEHAKLKRNAKAAGVSMARLVRSALVAAKLLD